MNNFMLLVCLPQGSTQPAELHTQLAAGLARFDRSRRVPPYRIDADLSPAMLDRVLRAFNRTDTLDSADLDDPRQLWTAILAAHNGDLNDESDRLYLNPDGRPYQLHTTNPLGRFDRWIIGGRWRGRFVATPDAQPAQLIHPERVGDRWRCAGGLLHALDLAGMRADAAAVADAAYDRWEATVAGTPTAAPWQVFADRHHADPDRYPYAAALADFHSQPRVRALRHHDTHAGSAPRFGSALTPSTYTAVVDEYQAGRDVYVNYRARLAVLGYALLTSDGQWLTPGHNPGGPREPVTFADRLAYTERATTHLDGLDPQTLLVGLTCHA
jgi:hypothetical protein